MAAGLNSGRTRGQNAGKEQAGIMAGFLRTWIIGSVLLFLSACSGGAVVFAPTPLPPESVPVTYEHPSGAFSLLLPRTWALHEQATAAIASASFTAPNSDVPKKVLSRSILALRNKDSLHAAIKCSEPV